MRKTQRRVPFAVAALAVLAVAVAACSGVERPNPMTPGQVKIRYGPFHVPDMNSPGTSPWAGVMPLLGARMEKGMIWNQPATDISKPCDNCYITGMVAGLEYPDGSNANINTGMWLHHMVLFDQGQGTSDATCAGRGFSLPHFAVGGSPDNTERIFASGNERTPLLPSELGNHGYKVNQGDKFHALVDLMNMTTTAKDVYLTMTYDYVPASTPGIGPVKPVWFDVAQCGTSEVPAQTGRYTLASQPWTSTVRGTILGGAGHLHDGGTDLTIERNGNVICDSVAKYGTKPEYIDPGGMDHGSDGSMDHSHGGSHISEQSWCTNMGPINPGDSLMIKGNYDDSLHPQMEHDGQLHQVMAISIMYVAV